jgi:hypothetical protein
VEKLIHGPSEGDTLARVAKPDISQAEAVVPVSKRVPNQLPELWPTRFRVLRGLDVDQAPADYEVGVSPAKGHASSERRVERQIARNHQLLTADENSVRGGAIAIVRW